jgi:hypothetical protein
MARPGFPIFSFIFCILAGGLWSCSALIDSSGFSSGAPAGGVGNEGGSDASSSGTADSSSSSSSSSSSGDAGDAAGAPLCGAPSRFCATFDNITTTDALPLVLVRGTAKLTTVDPVSAPHGLEFETMTTAADKANASLDLRLGPSVATLHVEYDVRLLAAPLPAGYVETTFIRVDSPGAPNGYRCALFLSLDAGSWKWNARCDGSGNTLIIDEPPRVGVWTHVVWDVRADNTGTLRFGDRTLPFTLASPGLVGGDLHIFAGVYYAANGSGRTHLVIDNVLVRD